MKKNIIVPLCAILLLILGVAGCSDNYNDLLEPLETPHTLAIAVESRNYSGGNLNLGAAPSVTEVKVESNCRWYVEVEHCDGGWCEVDNNSGLADGSFRISVRENMRALRQCVVKVYKTDVKGNRETEATADITVKQEASDVRLSPSSLESFEAASPRSQEFEIVSNVAWKLSVRYETAASAEFITIHPVSGSMEADGNGVFSGTGDATFRIILDDNRLSADRMALITLESEVGSYSVEVCQLGTQFAFDVDPAYPQSVPMEGGTLVFGVLSLTSDWAVVDPPAWIHVEPSNGMASPHRQEVVVTVDPNLSGHERPATISFKPRDSRYKPVDIDITQTSFSYFFSVSPMNTLGIIEEEGGERTLSITSRFDWEISAPDWIAVSENRGAGSEKTERPAEVRLTAGRLSDMTTRSGVITVRPLSTHIGDLTIDPATVNVEPVYINVIQYGGQAPAISIPWIRDNFTQTSATVEFNYYSPYQEISNAGVQWRQVGESSWQTRDFTVTDPVSGTVSVTLEGLLPATRYEVRGFVEYNHGANILIGETAIPFQTAGARPEESDNPTPSLIRRK